MEKENKDILENTEQEENSNEQNEQTKRKKYNIKKILFIALGITLVLCLGIFISFKIYTTEIHVYEEVENLAEREGVCFDNLLLSSCITLLNSSGVKEFRHLCIFNTGDIYCFEWPEESSWNIYYRGHEEEDYKIGYDETVWDRMCNVVYLGRLSNRDTICLNQYVQDFNPEGKYYVNYNWEDITESDNYEKYWQIEETGKENYIWEYYHVRLYQHGQSGEIIIIESCDMNYLGKNTYGKGELWFKSYEENALAALELFEFSGFYDRWIRICLNNGNVSIYKRTETVF